MNTDYDPRDHFATKREVLAGLVLVALYVLLLGVFAI